MHRILGVTALVASAVVGGIDAQMPIQQAAAKTAAAAMSGMPITMEPGAAAKPGKGILGKIKINGATYEATCDCSKDALSHGLKRLQKEKEDVACRLPSKYSFFYQKPAAPVDKKDMLTVAQLKTLLPPASQLQFVDVKKRTLSDIDGRQKGHVVGALGGEIGEFILAFSVYNRILGHDVKASYDAKRYLKAWLKEVRTKNRSFGFHWDEQAIQLLREDIEDETPWDMDSAKDSVRKKILGEDCKTQPCGLANSRNIGIDHIKYMMMDADRQANQQMSQSSSNGYMVPRPLIVDSIRAIFKILWDADDASKNVIKYSALPKTTQEEKAFVILNVASGCRAKGFAPSVAVKDDKSSIYAYHPDAVAVRRSELCAFFERMDTTGHVKKDAMCRQVERQGNLHLALTARMLSKNMPIYSVNKIGRAHV